MANIAYIGLWLLLSFLKRSTLHSTHLTFTFNKFLPMLYLPLRLNTHLHHVNPENFIQLTGTYSYKLYTIVSRLFLEREALETWLPTRS